MVDIKDQALDKDPVSAPEPGDKKGVTGQDSPPEGQDAQIPPEPLDETGVPYKNRVAELQRKNLEAQTKLKAYEDFYRNQTQAKPASTEHDVDAELLELANKDAGAFVKKLRQVATEDAISTMNRTLRQQSEQRLISQYPDIANPDSEFAQEVRREADYLRSYGFEPLNSPTGLESVVSKVAARLKPKNGNPPPPVQPKGPQAPENQFFTQGKPPGKSRVPEVKMSDNQMQLAKMFGLKESNIKRLNERYQRGDFDIGGGR